MARIERSIRELIAMVKEGTLGKYALRAVEPKSRRSLMELFATQKEVAAPRVEVERAGYTVIVTVDEAVPEGWKRPTSASKPRW